MKLFLEHNIFLLWFLAFAAISFIFIYDALRHIHVTKEIKSELENESESKNNVA